MGIKKKGTETRFVPLILFLSRKKGRIPVPFLKIKERVPKPLADAFYPHFVRAQFI